MHENRITNLRTRWIQGGWTYPDLTRQLFYKDRSSSTTRMQELLKQVEDAKSKGQTHKVWRTAGDSNVRSPHAKLNGVSIPIDDDFIVNNEKLRVPSDVERGSPGNTFNCRCRLEFEKGSVVRKPLSAHADGLMVIIRYSDQSEERRSGGTRAWRNNNPGNLRNSAFSQRHGSIGEAGGFAVFPDEKTGTAALKSLLKGPTYQNLKLFPAIERYAPSSENNTENYKKFVEKITGIDGDTLISTLSDAQINSVVRAIRRIEGWQAGTVTNKTKTKENKP